MPQKEFSNSLKAKMYDFTYTPFMSSMVIAWIILNHKYLLIFLSKYSLDKKLTMLNKYDFSYHFYSWDIPYFYNIIAPILFGLFYTFIYPWFSKIFYSYTLSRRKKLKEIKTDIEDQTPITLEEAKVLKKENYEKTDKISELESKLISTRNDYDKKLATIEEDIRKKTISELTKKHENSINKLQQQYEKEKKELHTLLENQYKDAYNELSEESQEIKNLNIQYSKEISEYKLQIEKLQTELKKLNEENNKLKQQIPKKTNKKESDKDKVLRFLYESNYKPKDESNVLDEIVNIIKIPRLRATQILKELEEEKIIEKRNGSYIYITNNGTDFLVKSFYEK